MTIQRLNLDNTWLLEWGGIRCLIDPWLTGSEVYAGTWFNEQWHATTPVAPADVPSFDAIIITQAFSDHCHLETLSQLPADKPIYGDAATCRKIKQKLPDRDCRIIATAIPGDGTVCGPLHCRLWSSGRLIPPVFNTLVLSKGQEVVVFAAHGFYPGQRQLDFLSQYHVRLLGASCGTIKLPWLFGGAVNPGITHVRKLIELIRPEVLVDTHDEHKHTRGIVMKIARREPADLCALNSETTQVKVLHVRDYEPVII
jgi:L-ascorbate metabolism protein UlaG (beta-lactamase superfamily)